MASPAYYFVNGLTIYRLVTAPILVVLVYLQEVEIFKWMLAISFTTDALDGFLARRLKVVSQLGTKLDSIADDATLLAAAIAVIKLKSEFVQENLFLLSTMVFLVLLQNGLAFWRYGKMSSYHTYFAKAAMVLQGCFLILLFFLPSPPYWLFYPAAIVTILDLSEEIVLVFLLPKWEANVKGLYWVMKRKKTRHT
jgi:phosphatidylglycerophosphate synthase